MRLLDNYLTKTRRKFQEALPIYTELSSVPLIIGNSIFTSLYIGHRLTMRLAALEESIVDNTFPEFLGEQVAMLLVINPTKMVISYISYEETFRLQLEDLLESNERIGKSKINVHLHKSTNPHLDVTINEKDYQISLNPLEVSMFGNFPPIHGFIRYMDKVTTAIQADKLKPIDHKHNPNTQRQLLYKSDILTYNEVQ